MKRIHGHASRDGRTKEYTAYRNAYRRCNSPKHKSFKNYGERGIKFLFNSFEDFLRDVGPWQPGYTLDRIDPNGNYEVGNVRWATLNQQIKNKVNAGKCINGHPRKFGERCNVCAKTYRKAYWKQKKK